MLNRSQGTEQAQKTRHIKDEVRKRLALSDEVVIMVTELKCSEPGCPPIETVIALLGVNGRNLQTKIQQPVFEISAEHIHELCHRLSQDLASCNQVDTTKKEEICDGH